MKSFGSPAAGRAGGRVMDERCSSYVDFAVNGMMNERRGGARVSTSRSQREKERGARERGPECEEMKRSRARIRRLIGRQAESG